MDWLDRRFEITARGSNIRREIGAGFATFLAMAYITVVNPSILADAQMDFGAVFVATCLAAALGTLAMGILANYPIALAPGMGQNAFFTYTIVIGLGQPWQAALGMVFVSGVLFIILSVLPVREWLVNSIPRDLKRGIAGGIGLFLAFIALQNSGIVVDNPATLVGFGELGTLGPALAIVGFLVITALSYRGVQAAVVIGMLGVAAIAWLTGTATFVGVVSAPPSIAPIFMEMDLAAAFEISALTLILSLLLVDLFDTAGTLVAVAERGNLLDQDGRIPGLRPALLADSGATTVGAVFGTSSTTSYIESAAGVEAGGRTGLTAIVVGVLFLMCLWLAPLAQSVPPFATSAALLFVACSMLRSLADVDWGDLAISVPAVVILFAIPMSFSIADGIGLGFISYVVLMLLSGRIRDCSIAMIVISVIFLAKFALL